MRPGSAIAHSERRITVSQRGQTGLWWRMRDLDGGKRLSGALSLLRDRPEAVEPNKNGNFQGLSRCSQHQRRCFLCGFDTQMGFGEGDGRLDEVSVWRGDQATQPHAANPRTATLQLAWTDYPARQYGEHNNAMPTTRSGTRPDCGHEDVVGLIFSALSRSCDETSASLQRYRFWLDPSGLFARCCIKHRGHTSTLCVRRETRIKATDPTIALGFGSHWPLFILRVRLDTETCRTSHGDGPLDQHFKCRFGRDACGP
jgi:hypothetical protein